MGENRPAAPDPAVWRRGIGDAIAAVDVLKNQWRASRRKEVRQRGEELDQLLQHIFDRRLDFAPVSYGEAAAAGDALIASARALLTNGADDGK